MFTALSPVPRADPLELELPGSSAWVPDLFDKTAFTIWTANGYEIPIIFQNLISPEVGVALCMASWKVAQKCPGIGFLT